jgi:hypothetical protein
VAGTFTDDQLRDVVASSLFVAGSVYTRRPDGDLCFNRERPGPRWHGHGYFPRRLWMLEEGRLVRRRPRLRRRPRQRGRLAARALVNRVFKVLVKKGRAEDHCAAIYAAETADPPDLNPEDPDDHPEAPIDIGPPGHLKKETP